MYIHPYTQRIIDQYLQTERNATRCFLFIVKPFCFVVILVSSSLLLLYIPRERYLSWKNKKHTILCTCVSEWKRKRRERNFQSREISWENLLLRKTREWDLVTQKRMRRRIEKFSCPLSRFSWCFDVKGTNWIASGLKINHPYPWVIPHGERDVFVVHSRQRRWWKHRFSRASEKKSVFPTSPSHHRVYEWKCRNSPWPLHVRATRSARMKNILEHSVQRVLDALTVCAA